MRRPLGDRTSWACNFLLVVSNVQAAPQVPRGQTGLDVRSVPRTFKTRVQGQRWGCVLSGLRRVREVPGRVVENGHAGRLVRAQEFRGVQGSVQMPHVRSESGHCVRDRPYEGAAKGWKQSCKQPGAALQFVPRAQIISGANGGGASRRRVSFDLFYVNSRTSRAESPK